MGLKGVLLCCAVLWGCGGAPVVQKPAVTPAKPLTAVKPRPLYTLATPARKSYRPSQEMRYFLEVALGSEYGMANFSIKKWRHDLDIEVVGTPTEEDLRTVDRVIADLNLLIGPSVQMRRVAGGGNVRLHFVPHQEFYHYEPRGIVFYGGFFWGWWNTAGEIERARVVIGSDRMDQHLRNHYIREELTQILGLMNDSHKHPDSIFYQEYSETDHFSELDQRVIRMLYNRMVRPGMTDFQLMEILGELEKTALR